MYSGVGTLEELEVIKKEMEKELLEVEYEITHRKKLKKRYQYRVHSYNRTVSGGFAEPETTHKKLREYVYKDRIGTALITSGVSYEYKEDKSEELHSVMFLKQQMGVFDFLGKMLRKEHIIDKYKFEDLFRVSIEKMLEAYYLKEMDITKFKEDMLLLGQELDKLDRAEITKDTKEDIIIGIDLNHYTISYTADKIAIYRKYK